MDSALSPKISIEPTWTRSTGDSLFSPAWKISTFQIPDPRGSPVTEIESIAVSDEAGLTAVSSRSSLYVLDSRSIPSRERLVPQKIRGELFFPGALSFCPDGRYLAGALSGLGMRDEHNFEIIATEAILAMPHPPATARLRVSGAANVSCWSSDGNLLAIGTLDSETAVFDISELPHGGTPRRIASFSRRLFGEHVMSLSFSPDSRALVICYYGGLVRFVSLNTTDNDRAMIGNSNLAALPPGDSLTEARLPALPERVAWWKMMKTTRSWLSRRIIPADATTKLPKNFRNVRGSLSPDGTMLAISGEFESFWDAWNCKGWLADRVVSDASIKLLDLTDLDKRGRPVPREIASYGLNQEVHSVQFLGDGRHILIATQSCGYAIPNTHPPRETAHIAAPLPGQDSDLQAQLRVLRINSEGGKTTLEEVATLVQDCTWLQVAASRSARTICAGAYDGYGYIFQSKHHLM
jgi:hypothetical protein